MELQDKWIEPQAWTHIQHMDIFKAWMRARINKQAQHGVSRALCTSCSQQCHCGCAGTFINARILYGEPMF
eukprot:scaffold269655_cov26-Tisochrysis_lutea.AAC.1